MSKLILATVTALLAALLPTAADNEIRLVGRQQHTGVCSPSGAVALGGGKFLVGDDEDNCLRVYNAGQGGGATASLNLDDFLQLKDKTKRDFFKECDLEAAAELDGLIFWTGSHSNSKQAGDLARPNRLRFFAVKYEDGRLKPHGQPYQNLLRDLLSTPALQQAGLTDTLQAAVTRPSEPDGLNIEGLSATPEGCLLFGLRSPQHAQGGQRLAVLVTLTNPKGVIEQQEAPVFKPFLLDLGGHGVRSIEYIKAKQTYLIIAGPGGEGGPFTLYKWQGGQSQPQVLGALGEMLKKEGLKVDTEASPEALFIHPDTGEIQILIDEGDRKVNGVECKEINKQAACKDGETKHFTSFKLKGCLESL